MLYIDNLRYSYFLYSLTWCVSTFDFDSIYSQGQLGEGQPRSHQAKQVAAGQGAHKCAGQQVLSRDGQWGAWIRCGLYYKVSKSKIKKIKTDRIYIIYQSQYG